MPQKKKSHGHYLPGLYQVYAPVEGETSTVLCLAHALAERDGIAARRWREALLKMQAKRLGDDRAVLDAITKRIAEFEGVPYNEALKIAVGARMPE